MKYFLPFMLLLLSGCEAYERRLTVISTSSVADVKRIVVNEGDVLVCDKDNCRVVRK